MKRHYLWITVLCAALLCTSALAAPEESERFVGEIGYSGVVDAETGYAGGASRGRSDDTLVTVAEGVTYDRASGYFLVSLGDGAALRASVTDGLIVNAPAYLAVEWDARLALYRGGESVELPDSGVLDEAGDYVLNRADEALERRLLGFTVVDGPTNGVLSYSMPDGFYVREATLDGEEIAYDRYRVDLSREGSYHIVARCPDAELDAALDVVIDRTPPELTLDGNVGADGRVRGAVTFSGVGSDEVLTVERNGEPYRVTMTGGRGVLRETGSYVLTVIDDAGNTATYPFTILLYLDANALWFAILTVLTLCGVLGYVIWKRKHLRVR